MVYSQLYTYADINLVCVCVCVCVCLGGARAHNVRVFYASRVKKGTCNNSCFQTGQKKRPILKIDHGSLAYFSRPLNSLRTTLTYQEYKARINPSKALLLTLASKPTASGNVSGGSRQTRQSLPSSRRSTSLTCFFVSCSCSLLRNSEVGALELARAHHRISP